jgi:hypothetical protein
VRGKKYYIRGFGKKNPYLRRPLGIPRPRQEDNIKMNHREIEGEGE